MKNSYGIKKINIIKESKTLDEYKKVYTQSCQIICDLKLANRILKGTFNVNEATIIDEDIVAGMKIDVWWTCVGEYADCKYL